MECTQDSKVTHWRDTDDVTNEFFGTKLSGNYVDVSEDETNDFVLEDQELSSRTDIRRKRPTLSIQHDLETLSDSLTRNNNHRKAQLARLYLHAIGKRKDVSENTTQKKRASFMWNWRPNRVQSQKYTIAQMISEILKTSRDWNQPINGL
jgi:hypothetical protein